MSSVRFYELFYCLENCIGYDENYDIDTRYKPKLDSFQMICGIICRILKQDTVRDKINVLQSCNSPWIALRVCMYDN